MLKYSQTKVITFHLGALSFLFAAQVEVARVVAAPLANKVADRCRAHVVDHGLGSVLNLKPALDDLKASDLVDQRHFGMQTGAYHRIHCLHIPREQLFELIQETSLFEIETAGWRACRALISGAHCRIK